MKLKFRVWSPLKKQMFKENLVTSGDKFFVTDGSNLEEIQDGKLMMYTGYEDYNGFDIYEDDIVEYPLYDEDPFYARLIGVVNNKDGKWIITTPDSTGDPVQIVRTAELSGQNHVSIRGNLHQNPERISP